MVDDMMVAFYQWLHSKILFSLPAGVKLFIATKPINVATSKTIAMQMNCTKPC